MFASLRKNSDGTNSGQLIVRTIAAVLTGTYTSPSNLPSAMFDQASSSFLTGSYAIPTYWTMVLDSSASSGSGSILLSLPSKFGKTNYLLLCYAGTHRVYFQTGNAYVSSTLQNMVEAYPFNDPGWPTYGLNTGDAFVNLYLNIVFADNFVIIWSPDMVTSYSSWYWQNMFVGVDMSNNAYDSYSQEGTFKIFSFFGRSDYQYQLWGTIGVSNFYTPVSDSYTTRLVWGTCYNNWLNDTNNTVKLVDVSRQSNAIDPNHLLVPICFTNLSKGWLGGNISNLCGLYLTTSSANGWTVTNNDTVTIGNFDYRVLNKGAGNAMGANTFLIRI